MSSLFKPHSARRCGALRRRSGLTLVLLLACPFTFRGVAADDPAVAVSPDTLAAMRTLIEQSRFDLASWMGQRQLAHLDHIGSPDSLARAQVLERLVENQIRGTGPVRGTPCLDQATTVVRIKERAFGPDHLELGGALMYLGRVYHRLNQLEEARAACARSLAIRRRWLEPSHPDVAASLHHLARIDHAKGDTMLARQGYEEAIAIREKSLPTDHTDLAVSLSNLAILHVDRGDDASARPLFLRALGIYQRTQPDHFNASEIHKRLANLASRADDYLGARYHLEQTLAIRERTRSPDSGALMNALEDLAALLRESGDYERALALHRRVIETRNRYPFSTATTLTGQGYHAMGPLLRDMGDYAGSRSALERAVAIYDEDRATPDLQLAGALHELAITCLALNEDGPASSQLERALAIRRQKLPPDDPETARSLLTLADIHQRRGQLVSATRLAQEALAMAQRRLGPRHSLVATILERLGRFSLLAGDTLNGHDHLRQALTTLEALKGRDHIHVARVLDLMADVLRARADADSARMMLERALAIRRRVLGDEHPEVGQSLLHLARWLAQDGELAAAFDRGLEAERIRREHVRLTSRSLPEAQALRYAASKPEGLDLALSLAATSPARIPEATTRAWDAVIRARGLVVEEMAARRRRVAAAGDSITARLARAVMETRRRLAHLTLRGAGDTSDVGALLAVARRENLEAERKLAERSASFREEQARRMLGYGDALANLPDAASLVAYARFQSERPGGSREEQYVAFVQQGRRDPPRLVPLGEAAPIEASVARWRRLAGRPSPAAKAREADAECRAAGLDLRARIWDRLQLEATGGSVVFLVPDGALQLVSFAALPEGENRYLLEAGRLIHVLALERDLVREKASPMPPAGLLAIGSPDFEVAPGTPSGVGHIANEGHDAMDSPATRSACGVFRDHRFSALREAASEVHDLVDLWQSRIQPVRHQAILARIGEEASEAEFKRLAPGVSILHVASHGFFLGESCDRGGVNRRGIGGLMESGVPAAASPGDEDPLLLSGLALAGANRRNEAPPEMEDGILTAAEIAVLDLSHVELAVLSACQTGLGQVRAGEGVLGLRRAFQMAGARSLVTSLWSVEDPAARSWMRVFYEARLAQGRGVAEAARDASLRALQECRARGSDHPFRWATFVASGDWE